MLKYHKELEYIMNYYENEQRKRTKIKENAVKTISKNMDIMKKIQNINASKIKDEIDRKNKSREFRSKENKTKLCNEM